MGRKVVLYPFALQQNGTWGGQQAAAPSPQLHGTTLRPARAAEPSSCRRAGPPRYGLSRGCIGMSFLRFTQHCVDICSGLCMIAPLLSEPGYSRTCNRIINHVFWNSLAKTSCTVGLSTSNPPRHVISCRLHSLLKEICLYSRSLKSPDDLE